MRHRQERDWGRIYRRTGRQGETLPTYWLDYKLKGKPRQRQPTNPPTEDEQEAKRQLRALLGTSDEERRQRERVGDLIVNDLLALYLAHCADRKLLFQWERVKAWSAALGVQRVGEVYADDLESICRTWQERGIGWEAGRLEVQDETVARWAMMAAGKGKITQHGTGLSWGRRLVARPATGSTCNRFVAVLRKAYKLGQAKRGLAVTLVFPRFPEEGRGAYLDDAQCRAICAHFQAKRGAAVKADAFRLAYLLGIRKGQLRKTTKRHVRITGTTWRLAWAGTETKNKRPHEVLLVGEALAIVQRAWATRRPDCDWLFHVDGTPLGPMRSELQRTCATLGIPYGRNRGVVFHDTRHSAVTNLIGAGVSETVAMTITGHVDRAVFSRYCIRRDDIQADALTRQAAYLEQQTSTEPTTTPPVISWHNARHNSR